MSKVILFYQEYIKKVSFLSWLHQKTQMKKSSIFGQKPWIIPLGKCLFLAPFKTLTFWSKIILVCLALLRTILFWSKQHSFLSKISKTISSDLIIPKKKSEKRFDFWTKTIDYPLTIMSIFWHFLKRYFSGLEIFFFYPKYEEKNVFWLDHSKNQNEKKFDFRTKTMD